MAGTHAAAGETAAAGAAPLPVRPPPLCASHKQMPAPRCASPEVLCCAGRHVREEHHLDAANRLLLDLNVEVDELRLDKGGAASGGVGSLPRAVH